MSEVDETIQMLRAECEALGIKWHSRHSEEGLRKLITESDVGDDGGHDPLPDGMFRVRVTKWGDGKISNGEGGFFKRDDELTLTELQAEQLDAKRYVEDLL